jgi:hypothetical protein
MWRRSTFIWRITRSSASTGSSIPVERQIEFLRNEDGRFVVVVPDGPEYRSQALPEIRSNLIELWRDVDAELPGS